MSLKRVFHRISFLIVLLLLLGGLADSLTLRAQEMATEATPAPEATAEMPDGSASADAAEAGAAGEASEATAEPAAEPAAPAAEPAEPTAEAMPEPPAPAAEAPALPPDPPAGKAYNIAQRTRAIWIDMIGETYRTRTDSDRIIRQITSAGFNTAYLVVMSDGLTMYPSEHLPLSPLLSIDDADAVKHFLDAANAAESKLEVHLVALPLQGFSGRDVAAAPPNNILARHPDWVLANDAGQMRQEGNLYTLDPALDAVQQFCEQALTELARRYPDVAGIQLHEMRYPGRNADWGYGKATIDLYNQETGASDEQPLPEDVAWQGWRRERLTKLVASACATIQKAAPKVQVSVTGAALGLPPETQLDWENSATYAGALQDWRHWGELGLADEIVLLNFQSTQFDPGYFEKWNAFLEQNTGGRRYVVGVGKAENFAEEVLGQIRQVLATGAAGVALYSFQEPNIEDIRSTLFMALGRGLFNVEYGGLRHSNIRVDPRFAGELNRGFDAGALHRSRGDLEIPDEFQREPTLPVDEEAAAVVAVQPESAPAEPKRDESASLLPDIVHLNSGGYIRGRIISETASSVKFRDEAGFELTIQSEDIREIQRAKR